MQSSKKENVLITGPTSGIGYEIAHQFAAHGHNLILVSRNSANLDAVAVILRKKYGVTVMTIAANLSEPDSPSVVWRECEKRGCAISVLVNNAGCSIFGKFHESNIRAQLNIMRLNMAGLVHLTHLFLQPMIRAGRGRILNVSSLGAFSPCPLTAIYGATKAFTLSFSCALSEELQDSGVTVTALCPGGTVSKFQAVAGVKVDPNAMTANEVAEIGYRACMSGKRVSVAGKENTVKSILFRMMPLAFGTKIVHYYHKKRAL